jgi:hypothetical protein
MQADIAPSPALPPAVPLTQRSRLSPVTYVGMFLLTLVLWLPFSFKTTGLIEEWSIVRFLESGSQLFFITPHSAIDQSRLRPLLTFVHSAAYALDPDSFLYFNVFLLLFMFGKMVAACWLVLQFLPRQRVLAFVAGVLFVVYPADTAMFTLRALQIHAAACSYLFAAYLLIRFARRPARAGWTYLAGAAGLLLFSLMTYQLALPLAILTPLTALAFVRPSDRRLWMAIAVWYGAITIPLLYAVWAYHQSAGTPYEMALLATKPAAAASPLADVMGAIGLAYERQATGWATAWQELGRYPQLRAAVLAALALFAATGAWVARDERRDPAGRPASTRRYLIVAIVAAGIVVLGMAVFLALPTHRRQDFRIYFLSMSGSALVLALLLFSISRAVRSFRSVVFLMLAVPFVGLGYTHALQNHQTYVNYSLEQQQVLQDVVAEAPRLTRNSFVIFLDETGAIDKEYLFYYGFYLGTGLKYVYGDPSIDAGYCPLTSPGALGTSCTFDASAIHIKNGLKIDVTVPYDRVVFLANSVDDHFRLVTPDELAAAHRVTGYKPQARIAGTVPPPRAATMFSCEPALSCYRESTASATSFDLPNTGPIGRGWRAPEPDAGGGTFRWSLIVEPTVSVNLAHAVDLALEFHITMWLDRDVVDSLTLSLNGTMIPLTYEPAQPAGRLYHAVLPREVLARSSTHTNLVFHVNRLVPVPSVPDVKLGIALSSLRIRPR